MVWSKLIAVKDGGKWVDLQIKTMSYHCMSIGIPKNQNTDNAKCWQGCGTIGTLIHYWWEYQMVWPLWKTSGRFFQSFNIWSSNCTILLALYSNKLKTHVHPKTCIWIFMSPLLIIAKTWKHPSCPSVSKQINTQWCSQTMEYFSAQTQMNSQATKRQGGNLSTYC